MIYAESGRCFRFGCDSGGDVFDFVGRPCLPHSDVGTAVAEDSSAEAHAVAVKAAATDALKRALRHFGARFGNGLGN